MRSQLFDGWSCRPSDIYFDGGWLARAGLRIEGNLDTIERGFAGRG